MNRYTVLFIALLPLFLAAQVDTLWVNRWTSTGAESDWGYAIALGDEGHVYVTGKTENPSTNGDWTTIKYKPNGDTAWVRNFVGAGSANERASSITIGPSGKLYLTGYTMSSGAGDYLTIKYQPDGDTVWTRRYDGIGAGYDFAHWVCTDEEENVYVTGYSRALSYQNDIATVKYDSSGTQQWAALFDGSGHYSDKGHKVICDNNGHVYVVGYVNPFGTGTRYDYVTIKYDAETGDTVWARTYNGTADSSDIARDIEVDAYGNVYVTGSCRNTGTMTDIVTIKYDSLGVEQWVAQYNNADTSLSDGGYGLEVDAAGYVYVCGQSQGAGTGSDIVVIKYDQDGNQLWATRYDGDNNDYDTPSDEVGGKCMTIDGSSTIYVTGCSRGAISWNDYITLAFTPDSILQWDVTYNCCDSTDYALAIAADDSGNVAVTGRSINVGTYYDMATVKYWSSVGIEESSQQSTGRLSLQVYPNPFRTQNTIRYAVPSATSVRLSIFDVSGRLIKTLVDAQQTIGTYSVVWNGTDNAGQNVSSGIYFSILNAGGEIDQQKIILSK